ncbi:MAG: hypothetical protein ACR2PL_16810, partial [Dehalococcoidia bacterium]
MMIDPPPRDIIATSKPHTAFRQTMLDNFAQPGDSACLSDQAWMEADRHHLWISLIALTPQLVNAPLAEVGKIIGASIALEIVIGQAI